MRSPLADDIPDAILKQYILVPNSSQLITEEKAIPLSQGFCAIVDVSDFDWLSQYSWFVWIPRDGGDRTVYAVRKRLIKEGRSKPTKILMHREILGAKDAEEVDHIHERDGISGLDNRRTNLRFVTTAQNQWNSRKHSDASTSRFKGVVFWKNRWQAQIQCKGRRIYLGRFTTEMLAAAAYNEAAKNLFGNFARLNVL